MSTPEDPRIWHGLRAHLDELGSLPTVPPIGSILDRRPSRRSFRAVVGLAGAGAIALAIALLLPGLRAGPAPIAGATPGSSSAPATQAALPTAAPVDAAELIGYSYVATEVTEHGQPLAIVADTQLVLGFGDASQFGASAGCNGMGGDYHIQDGRLVTANVYMTLKGCLGALGRQESWYYTFLQSSPTISRATTGLLLTSSNTVVTYVEGSAKPAHDLTWVAVTGPADSRPPEDLVLEIGGMAWDGYGGVVSLPTSGATEVRLLGRETCRTYAKFVAKSGSSTVIRFSKDGQVAIEDWTGRGTDAGPALAHRQLSDCPET